MRVIFLLAIYNMAMELVSLFTIEARFVNTSLLLSANFREQLWKLLSGSKTEEIVS